MPLQPLVAALASRLVSITEQKQEVRNPFVLFSGNQEPQLMVIMMGTGLSPRRLRAKWECDVSKMWG